MKVKDYMNNKGRDEEINKQTKNKKTKDIKIRRKTNKKEMGIHK
jgi:hypothetical protein